MLVISGTPAADMREGEARVACGGALAGRQWHTGDQGQNASGTRGARGQFRMECGVADPCDDAENHRQAPEKVKAAQK